MVEIYIFFWWKGIFEEKKVVGQNSFWVPTVTTVTTVTTVSTVSTVTTVTIVANVGITL